MKDANGSRFALLLGLGDWGGCALAPERPGSSALPTLAALWAAPPAKRSATPLEFDARTSVLSLFNLAAAIAVVIGAGCGALLFHWLGPELRGYAVLFLISSSLRIAGLLYLRRSIGS